MNGAEYCLVTDPNEIGDADFAYEIKSGSSQEDICGIIWLFIRMCGIENRLRAT